MTNTVDHQKHFKDWVVDTNLNVADVLERPVGRRHGHFIMIANLVREIFKTYDYDIFKFMEGADESITRSDEVLQHVLTIQPNAKRRVFQTEFPHPDLSVLQYTELFLAMRNVEKHVLENILKTLYKHFGVAYMLLFIKAAACTEQFVEYMDMWDKRTLGAALRKLDKPLFQYNLGMSMNQQNEFVAKYVTTEQWIDLVFGDKPPRKFSAPLNTENHINSLTHLDKFIKVFNGRVDFGKRFWKSASTQEIYEYLLDKKSKKSKIITDLNEHFVTRMYSLFVDGEISQDLLDTMLVSLYSARKTSTMQQIKRINRTDPKFGQVLLSFINL